MRKKNKSYNFLRGRRSFYYRDIFSSLSNEKMSPALYSYSSATTAPAISPPAMKKRSSTECIPKQSLDNILHYLLMQEINTIKNVKELSSPPQKRHPHFIFQYYKNFQLTSRLKGSALSLFKRQFIKKPKNPE